MKNRVSLLCCSFVQSPQFSESALRARFVGPAQTVTTATVTANCFRTCTKLHWPSLDSLSKMWIVSVYVAIRVTGMLIVGEGGSAPKGGRHSTIFVNSQ